MRKLLAFTFLLSMSSTITIAQTSYGINKMRASKWIRELKEWEDQTDLVTVSDNENKLKFFSSGISLKLKFGEDYYELYGSDLKYSEKKESSGQYAYVYKGFAKEGGATVGNFEIWIVDHQYNEMENNKDAVSTNGNIECLIYYDRIWANIKGEGLINSFFRGAEKYAFDLYVK